MMFISSDSSTGAPRSGAAAGTTRTDCGRLVQDRQMSGGKGAKGGNLQSLGNRALFDDGAKRRKLAETGGNSFWGAHGGAKKVFSGARIAPLAAIWYREPQMPDTGLLSSRAPRGTFTAASKAPPFGFAQGRRYARGDSYDSPFSDSHAHCCPMPSSRRAVGDWQNACGNCGNSRDASRRGFVSALGGLQVGNRLAVAEIAEIAEIGRGVCALSGRRPRCLTGIGVAPILPHRKNGLKSRKHKAF
jgi:hypothetical protein